ncbi:MAG: hypothetical protein Q4F50_05700 [Bacteroides sp.]|uniref:hypothetical protein n=1 Tax=Bacteroides sp. TaxID=29523 RepID=UPI0026DFD675|nr:hypothetical protein [Bacteroides sp.]MDO5419540.1 hypothetical protein [Bacteroides sp.]
MIQRSLTGDSMPGMDRPFGEVHALSSTHVGDVVDNKSYEWKNTFLLLFANFAKKLK